MPLVNALTEGVNMTTIPVPTEYNAAIVKIIDWHLKAYEPDMFFDDCITRIRDCFSQENLVDGVAQVKITAFCDNLHCLHDCFSDATNNIAECGVNEDLVWEIYNWIAAEREQRSHTL